MPRTDSKNTPPTAQNTGRPKFLVTTALPLLAGVAVLMATSCTGQETEDPGGGMNRNEAAERVEEHINESVSVLPESVELEPGRETNFAACDDPTDGGPQGRIIASRVYRLSGLPTEDNGANAELLHQHWSDKGYKIMRDRRLERIYISAETSGDSFIVFLRSSVQGTLSLGASSPCFWPDGAP